MLLQFVPLFLPSPPSIQPTPHFHSQSPRRCPYPSYMGPSCCSLTNRFTFFQPVPTTPEPLTTASLFHVSMPLVLFCLLVYFVHQVPLISDITQYFVFH